MAPTTVKLSPEESANLKEKLAALDGEVRGFAKGIEAAKQLILQQFLEKRNDAIAQQGHAAAGHAPVSANQPVSAVQPAGAGGEPERPSVPADGRDSIAVGNAVFPIRGTAEQWLERAWAGDDGTGNGAGVKPLSNGTAS